MALESVWGFITMGGWVLPWMIAHAVLLLEFELDDEYAWTIILWIIPIIFTLNWFTAKCPHCGRKWGL